MKRTLWLITLITITAGASLAYGAAAGGKIKVYSGEVIGLAQLNVPGTAALGKSNLRVEVHFQACDDKECDRPQKVLLSLPIEVVEANAEVKPTNEAIFKPK